MKNKRQHWVPKTYLNAWIDPDSPHNPGYLWIFSKNGSTCKNKSPENVFSESDFYTDYLTNGKRDLSLEKQLASIESKFSKLMKLKLSKQQTLSEEESVSLFLFVAAMLNRTKSQRDHHKAQWSNLHDAMNAIKVKGTLSPNAHFGAKTPLSSSSVLSIEEVEKIKKAPLQKTLLTLIKGTGAILARMNLNILYTSNQPGFITSDSPCVVFDPELTNRPFSLRTLGLGFSSVEITFPLSPQLMIFLHWKESSIENHFVEISDTLVDEINMRTRFFCKEYFIVNQKIKKEVWFKDTP